MVRLTKEQTEQNLKKVVDLIYEMAKADPDFKPDENKAIGTMVIIAYEGGDIATSCFGKFTSKDMVHALIAEQERYYETRKKKHGIEVS